MSKKMTVQDAIGLIRDGDTLAVGGFVGCMHPEDLTQQLERTFKETRHPQNLDLIYAAGQGDGHERGLNHLGHEGMLRRVVGGHWGLVPKIQKLALENKIEAYNFPQGVISHLFRDIAAKKPGTLTHIGLKTFVDPRLQGGRINDITKDDLVTNLTIGGKEYLLYHAFPIHVALVRASYCDPDGNATFERECVSLEVVAMCQAAKNSGGKVILQVEKIVERGSLNPKLIRLPGIYVDAIIEAPPENHMQTFDTQYDPSYSGDI
ncbi:MAG: CoA-transferase, partial [Christensenella sp.]|uniref:CoA-transferase n=1 Tax=Christensenella sp. TaxID=1935934 RepID=UPI002B20212C